MSETANIAEKIEKGAVVLDVRSGQEFAAGHYPNAINIPVGDVMARSGDVGPKDTPVVVYCESGQRSELARLFLKAAGFTDVTNAGGLREMPPT